MKIISNHQEPAWWYYEGLLSLRHFYNKIKSNLLKNLIKILSDKAVIIHP